MTSKWDWRAQIGRSWADNYRLTDRTFTGLTERLLGRIGGCESKAVLDIGCGAGELSLALARGNRSAEIIGIDVSADLIAAARKRGGAMHNATFVEADAAMWQADGFTPDLIVSRHGVMFFDAPRDAFAHLRDLAQPAAELVFSCFRSPVLNPWGSELAGLLKLPPNADPTAPGPFAFADEAHVRAILEDAGWNDAAFEEVDFAYIAGLGDEPIDDALKLFSRIGPAAPALRALDADAHADADRMMRRWLEQYRSGDLVALPAAAWIVSARS